MFETCPLLNGPCVETKCRWFVQLQGTNPQTGQSVDTWNCSVALLPMLLIENAQESRQTGAAVESFRNEMVVANQRAEALALSKMNLVGLPRDVRSRT